MMKNLICKCPWTTCLMIRTSLQSTNSLQNRHH